MKNLKSKMVQELFQKQQEPICVVAQDKNSNS